MRKLKYKIFGGLVKVIGQVQVSQDWNLDIGFVVQWLYVQGKEVMNRDLGRELCFLEVFFNFLDFYTLLFYRYQESFRNSFLVWFLVDLYFVEGFYCK